MTLSLEEQFYLFWPALLLLLRRRRAGVVAVVILCCAPGARLLSFHMMPNILMDGQLYRMFHTRIDTIMTGCVLALVASEARYRDRLVRLVNERWLPLFAAAVVMMSFWLDAHANAYHMWLGVSIEAVALATWCATRC